MKFIVAAAVAALSLAAASPALAALGPGDQAPDFVVRGALDGKPVTVKLSDLLAQGPVVVYFFPSAFTDPSESREFARDFDKFREAGASVIGMSRDSLDTLTGFSVEACGGRFPVASADVDLVNAFDVNDGAMFNTRTTYVIAPSGRIAFVHDEIEPGGHVAKTLAFVRAMKVSD